VRGDASQYRRAATGHGGLLVIEGQRVDALLMDLDEGRRHRRRAVTSGPMSAFMAQAGRLRGLPATPATAAR